MKAAIIADVHQKLNWKKILPEIESLDKVYFVGDYFDHHGDYEVKDEEAVANFEEIVALKEKYPDKVFMCLGNHDSHYLPCIRPYSSYQSGHNAEIFSNSLLKHSKDLNICYRFGNYVISHAGVTKTWYNNQIRRIKENKVGISAGDFELKIEGDYIDIINSWIHAYFKAIDEGMAFYKNGDSVPSELSRKAEFLASMFEFPKSCWDPYGDDVICPPVWIRPGSALADALFEYQVVGHTGTQAWFYEGPEPLYLKKEDTSENKMNHMIFIDNDNHDNILYLEDNEPLEDSFQEVR